MKSFAIFFVRKRSLISYPAWHLALVMYCLFVVVIGMPYVLWID